MELRAVEVLRQTLLGQVREGHLPLANNLVLAMSLGVLQAGHSKYMHTGALTGASAMELSQLVISLMSKSGK